MNRLGLLCLAILLGFAPPPTPPPPTPVSPPRRPVTTPVIPGKEGMPNSTRFEFQGDMPGVTKIAEFTEKHQLVDAPQGRDRAPGIHRYRRLDLEDVTFEGVPVTEAYYRFVDDALRLIELKLAPDPDNLVPAALLARYGPSDNPKTSSYEHAWDTPTSLLFCVRGEFPSVVLADLAPRDEAGRRSTKQSGTGVKEQ